MRKLMLAVLVPVVLGSVFHTQEPVQPMPADASPKFDVATIRPSKPSEPGTQPQGFDLRGRHVLTMSTSVDDLISFAYGVNAKQIIDAPPWSNVDKFDIDGVPDVEGQPNQEQMKMLFQRLLEDWFHLKFHHDQRELSVLALTVAKGGPKLAMTIHTPTDPVTFAFERQILTVSNSTMREFCNGMQGSILDRPVVDQTGLTGRYDLKLSWTPDESQFFRMGVRIPPPPEDPNAPPDLYTAIREQLGLKLEATKAKADVIVIDRLEQPTQN